MHPAAASKPRRWVTGPWPAVVLALACYANSLSNGFVYDDNSVIVANPRITSLTNFRDIWLRDWWFDQSLRPELQAPGRDRLYRPLTMYSFAVNYAIGGLRPFGYHVFNVLLHAAACGLLWHWLRRLTGRDAIAALGAALFAVHPVHAEAVANGVGRAEVLATVFLLLGLLTLAPRDARLTTGRMCGAAAAFLAAIFSKETAVCFLPVALIALWFMRCAQMERIGVWLRRAAVLALPLAIYFPLRFYALESHFIREEADQIFFNPVTDTRGLERVLAPLTILGHYTRLTFAPNKLSADYGFAILNPHEPLNLMTILGALALAAIGVGLTGYRSAKPARRLIAALLAMWTLSYALISNTFLLIGVSLAERLWYWPSVLVLAMIAALVVEIWDRQVAAGAFAKRGPLLRTLGVALLAALALRTVVRNADWATDDGLFLADAATYPEGAHLADAAGNNLVSRAMLTPDALERIDLLNQAEVHLKRALQIKARFPEALYHLGLMYFVRGDLSAARTHLEEALLLDPMNARARRCLSMLSGSDADLQVRFKELQERVRATPDDPRLRLELGDMQLKLGAAAEALDEYRIALRLTPDDPETLRRYGDGLIANQQLEPAATVFLRLVEIKPDDWQAHANLADLLRKQDPAASLRHAQRAFDLQPNNLQTAVNLAEAFALNRRIDEALNQMRRIERGLPPDAPFLSKIRERIRELEAQR